jgi:hypothetical protein
LALVDAYLAGYARAVEEARGALELARRRRRFGRLARELLRAL